MTIILTSIIFFGSCNDGEWTEFHGNLLNNGFTEIHSDAADLFHWGVPIDHVYFSSPAVGPDGVVYIGTTDGNLVAVSQFGAIKFKDHLAGSISSPTIGDDGNIYITNINQIDFKTWSSSLFSLKSYGTYTGLNWWYAFPDNGYTTASPKVWSSGDNTFTFVRRIISRGVTALKILEK
jgi:outer membrane protein assembly factor BamB